PGSFWPFPVQGRVVALHIPNYYEMAVFDEPSGMRATGHSCKGMDVMTTKSKLLRMDNVLIVVDDLEAAKAFFAELGMELEGETPVEGRWVDRVVGLNDVRADIAMMRTPDGHSRVELTKFHTPPAVRAEPGSAPANTLG